MSWKFWRSGAEKTDADRTLAALSKGAATQTADRPAARDTAASTARPAASPPASPPAPSPTSGASVGTTLGTPRPPEPEETEPDDVGTDEAADDDHGSETQQAGGAAAFSAPLSTALSTAPLRPRGAPGKAAASRFSMRVTEVIAILEGGTVLVGPVTSGVVTAGDVVGFTDTTGARREVPISAIEVASRRVESAAEGELAGILLPDLDEDEILRGTILRG